MTFRPFISASQIPSIDNEFSLGRHDRRWSDGYFGPGSVHVVSTDAESGIARDWTFEIEADGYLTIAESGTTIISLSPDGYLIATEGITFSDGSRFISAAGIGAIDPNSISDTELRDSIALSVIGRSANSTGDPGDIAGTVSSDQVLRISGTTLGFGTIATAGITDDAVTNAKLANMPTLTIKGNNTGSPADPLDLTAAQVKTLLAIAAGDVSGLSTIATSGSASDLSTGTIPDARMPDLTGDVTTTLGTVATTIAANAVTNTKLNDMPANTIKGNNTGGSADPSDLTAAQVTAILDTFTSSLQGLVPASGGSSSDFLRADGYWAAPSASGGVVGPVSATDNAVVRFDGYTGDLIQDSAVLITDAGGVWAGNGTAALPAFSFTSDPNTGIYNIGADQLGISTGGTLRALLDSDGLRLDGYLSLIETSSAAPSSAGYAKLYVLSSDSRLHLMTDAGIDQLVQANGQIDTVTWAASTALNFATNLSANRTLTLDNAATATTFTSSNLASGRAMLIRVLAQTTTHTLTFPVGWNWMGVSAPPSIASGQTAMLSLSAYGAADSDVVASWAYENEPAIIGGTGTINRVAYWSDSTTLTASANLSFDGASLGIGNTSPASTLDVTGSLGVAITTITAASATLDDGYHTVLADATSNAITINLPAVASAARRMYSIKKIDATANVVTVDANGSEVIDDAATYVLSVQHDSIIIQSNGTKWYIIAEDGYVAASGGGTGNVVGPASSTDNAVARFDATTGKLLQNSSVLITDTGTIGAAAGTELLPAFSFSTDPNTGIWNSAADTIAFSTGGAIRWTTSTTAISSFIPIQAISGSASIPGLSFFGDADTGIWNSATNSLSVATNGVTRLTTSTTAITSTLPILNQAGTAGAPAYSFSGDTGTGIWNAGLFTVGITTGGTTRWSTSTTAHTSTLPILNQAGTVALPAYSFSADPDTGIYRLSADSVGVSGGGVAFADFTPTEAVFNNSAGNIDFRIEGDGYAHLLFVDASVDFVGIRNSAPLSALDVNGSFGTAVSTITAASATLDATHHTILADATSNSITINLPAVATSGRRRYEIKKIDSTANTVTIDGNASETIDGAATYVISTQYQSVTIQSDGSNWWVL